VFQKMVSIRKQQKTCHVDIRQGNQQTDKIKYKLQFAIQAYRRHFQR